MTATSTPLPGLILKAAALSDPGKRRPYNEDRALVNEQLNLYVLADGAGGHNAGDVAAQIATESIVQSFQESVATSPELEPFDRFGLSRRARQLALAVQRANRDVLDASHRSRLHRGMGTTVVTAAFSPTTCLLHVAHVGDSRCYRFRAGQLELLTQDHSLLNDVLRQRPDLEDDVLARLPAHVVTRALGMDDKLSVSLRSYTVLPQDRYLLCSDGLSGPVPAEQLAAALASAAGPDAVTQELIDRANALGGPDNVTAVVIDAVATPDVPYHPPSFSEPRLESFDDDPEILILGIEELDATGPWHTASDGLLRSLGELSKRGK